MRFTRPLSIIFRRKGRPEWIELRESYLPKGFSIFDYSPKYYGSMICIFGFVAYAKMQSEINPGSIYTKIMNFTDYFMEAVTETVEKATDDGTNFSTEKSA